MSGTRWQSPEAVVMFSGGVQSFVAAQRAVARYGPSEVALLFADTSAEDADLYRFVVQASAAIGSPLYTVRDGRTPQQVLRARKFLGSGRGAPCSQILKRKPMDAWVAERAPSALQVFGLGWEELHRAESITAAKAPSKVWCPLTEPPYLTREDLFDAVRTAGLEVPSLYKQGHAHNNCGGACVRAGQGAWRALLGKNPELFASWEQWEQGMREDVGPYAILRDRTGGTVAPLTLAQLRGRSADVVDMFDIGGCGCAVDNPTADSDNGTEGQ